MAGTYASTTDVPANKSRDEIERTLRRFGATDFAYRMSAAGEVTILFEVQELRVRMGMQLPNRGQFRLDRRGNVRPDTAIERDWEQASRQRWRTLANAIKAKLAMVDDGISSVEEEFLSNIVVPATGQTYGELALPQISEVYRTGALPPMMPGLPSGRPKVIELAERAGGAR